MIHQRHKPFPTNETHIWVDCFFYGFYMEKNDFRRYQYQSSRVVKSTTDPIVGARMKRSLTERVDMDTRSTIQTDSITTLRFVFSYIKEIIGFEEIFYRCFTRQGAMVAA